MKIFQKCEKGYFQGIKVTDRCISKVFKVSESAFKVFKVSKVM